MGKMNPSSLIFFRWVGETHQPVKVYIMGVTFIWVKSCDIMEVTENSGQRYVWEKVLFDCFNGLRVRWNSDLPKSATLLPRLGQGSMSFVPNVVPPQHHPRFSKPQGLAIAKKEAARFSRLAYEARMEWLNQPDWWGVDDDHDDDDDDNNDNYEDEPYPGDSKRPLYPLVGGHVTFEKVTKNCQDHTNWCVFFRLFKQSDL